MLPSTAPGGRSCCCTASHSIGTPGTRSAARLRLICLDLRGFGWPGQSRRSYEIDGLSDDMLALLDALGLDRWGLVGHD
ncbi:alpha/beta fold hydrolase [Streptomyces sp. IBSBF 3136]|uniref:alpha/beta fold hydrolase n=1 Tax=Streptomyces sp. IBSBF 3136 TaxID=2903524 RepID=UPI003FA699BD